MVKKTTEQGGSWVVYEVHRQIGCFSGPDCQGFYRHYYYYKAINLESWTDSSDSLDATLAYENGTWLEVLSEEDNTYVDLETGTIVFETTNDYSKDLEKIGASLESVKAQELESRLVDRYGFTAQRAHSVAKITLAFDKVRKQRSLSKDDYNHFLKTVAGTTYKEFESASQSSDKSAMNNLIEKAAELNGTSLEAIKIILDDLF